VNVGEFQPGATIGTAEFTPVNRFFVVVNHNFFFILQSQAFRAFVYLEPRFQIKQVVGGGQSLQNAVGFVMKEFPALFEVIIQRLRVHKKSVTQVKILFKSTVAAPVIVGVSHNFSACFKNR
jgi:hypothetical protein